MTKAKAIRNFFKKFFNADVTGMSEVGALIDMFKKVYDIDAKGSTVSEVLTDVTDNNDELPGGGGGGGETKTAQVTFHNSSEYGTGVYLPVLSTVEGKTGIRVNNLSFRVEGQDYGPYAVPLINDGTIVMVGLNSYSGSTGDVVVLNQDAEINSLNLLITGDCTINLR